MTYPELVGKLLDLEALAQPPLAGEQGGNFSSYDRASRYHEETGLYEAWGANDDGTGYVRKEGEDIVALELDGPGVLWRIWSALPQAGHIRIEIDGRLAVDQPFRDFFEAIPQELCPKNFPNLLPTLSRGRNSWIPIPFMHHCVVTLQQGWGLYYHITYNRYPEGTTLPAYTGVWDRAASIALAEADRALQRRGEDAVIARPGETWQLCSVQIPAHGDVCLYRQDAPGAIRSLRIQTPQAQTLPQAQLLRALTLSMAWDGEPLPAVWTPLGDFFGAAPGVQPYRSLPMGMNRHVCYSHWYMPFASCNIMLHNDSDEDVLLTAQLLLAPLEEDPDGMLRFHAKWHRDALVKGDAQRFAPGGDRWPDWPLLQTEGKGRYCGLHLHVYNDWEQPEKEADTWWYGMGQDKSIDWWWGEGDEKFFVDGETFPSTFGTGSEDYIGYAWAAEPPFSPFDSAYAAQPTTPIDGRGHTSVNRFHIADNIPFQTGFEGFLEKYWGNIWGRRNRCLYAATLYWYLAPGGSDPYGPVDAQERWGYDHLEE